jgi:hypothetical protein
VEVVQSSVLDQLEGATPHLHLQVSHRRSEIGSRIDGIQLNHPESALHTLTSSGIISNTPHIIDDSMVSKTVSPLQTEHH